MSNLSNTQGEGGSGGRTGREFIDTGYQTHDGQGNVPTGAQWEKGTGYDEHGQVKTAFGKFPVAYDPVTGMAVDNVTAGYSFPAGGGGEASGGGLVDVSAAAQELGTHATPEMQRQVQEFFARREAASAGAGASGAAGAGAQAPPASGAAEETGQGVAERMDAGEYLEQGPTRTGDEASAWRRSGGRGREDDV